MKHGFTEEGPADGYAVQTADQLPQHRRLRRYGRSRFRVVPHRRAELIGDAEFFFAKRGPDDSREIAVNRDIKAPAANVGRASECEMRASPARTPHGGGEITSQWTRKDRPSENTRGNKQPGPALLTTCDGRRDATCRTSRASGLMAASGC